MPARRGPGLRSTLASPGWACAQPARRLPRPPAPAAPQAGPSLPRACPAPLRAAALLALALLAAAPPARAAKPVLRTTNPVTVGGTNVTLHYDQSLDGTKRPDNPQFTVTVGGQTVAVTGTGTSSASDFVVNLGFSIAPDEAVTIAYAKPDGMRHRQRSHPERRRRRGRLLLRQNRHQQHHLVRHRARPRGLGVERGRACRRTPASRASLHATAPRPPRQRLRRDRRRHGPNARRLPVRFRQRGGHPAGPCPPPSRAGRPSRSATPLPLGAASTVSNKRLFGSDAKLVQRFTTQTISNNTALVANTTKGDQAEQTFSFDKAPGVHHRQPRHPAGRREVEGSKGNRQGRSGLHRQHPLVQRFRPSPATAWAR